MIKQIKTSYTVLEVREQKHSDIAPIVLICETVCELPPQRRRIEIRNNRGDQEIYNTAKLIIKGDLIIVEETLICNVKKEDELCIRHLDKLVVNFEKEKA